MSDLYDRARATAARLLAPRTSGGYGAPMVLRKLTAAAYDPATGGAPLTPGETSGSALRSDFKGNEVDGSTVLATDTKFIVSPVALDGSDMPQPLAGDQVVFDGSTYQVIAVQSYNFVGLAVAWQLQGRA